MWRMTQQGYLDGLAGRLSADGCTTAWAEWEGTRALVGWRSDKRVRWMGTRVYLVTAAAEVPEVDAGNLAEFTSWAVRYAKHSLGAGGAGYGSVFTMLPVLAGPTVRPAAKAWARETSRVFELALAARPVAVDTRTSEVTFYRGKSMHGRMFVKHLLQKADLYLA